MKDIKTFINESNKQNDIDAIKNRVKLALTDDNGNQHFKISSINDVMRAIGATFDRKNTNKNQLVFWTTENNKQYDIILYSNSENKHGEFHIDKYEVKLS